MYIFYDEIIQKKVNFAHEKGEFWVTSDWLSSSTLVASRMFGIVWGASGMTTTQYQRTRVVPGALPNRPGPSDDLRSMTDCVNRRAAAVLVQAGRQNQRISKDLRIFGNFENHDFSRKIKVAESVRERF